MSENLLKVSNLNVGFKNNAKLTKVVRGVHIEVNEGEIVGVLGESGSGKSISALSILGLFNNNEDMEIEGEILYKGKDIMKYSDKQMRDIRGKEISYAFQDPVASLNPYRKIGIQIKEALRAHKIKYSKESTLSIMEKVGLREPALLLNKYPFQISGGQAQRIIIALAILFRPKLLIADEPTSAIDASVKKRILDLFKHINKNYGTALMIITHDFDVARFLCNKVVIMYCGLVMEQGYMEDIINNPKHPYTNELLKCVQSLDEHTERLYTLKGSIQSPTNYKQECPFYHRCNRKSEQCKKEIPPLKEFSGERYVRCINL